MSELKPCPFCGGKAGFDSDDSGYKWVECTNCGVMSDTDSSYGDEPMERLAKLWNNRAPQSEWVGVDMGELPFDQFLYFQLESGICGEGVFIDCCDYVRFKFGGTSMAYESWSSKPIRYTQLPTPPKGSGNE